MFQRRDPRPLRLIWRLTGWRAVLPLGTGAVFLLIGLAEPATPPPRTETVERHRVVDVDLVVTDVQQVADGWNDTALRIVSYEWRDPVDGGLRRDSETVPADSFPDIAPGDVIPFTLEYTREETIEVQDEATPWALAPVLLGLGGLVWAILAAWLSWVGWHVASAWRAARHGEVSEARVTGHPQAVTSRNPEDARLGWVDASGNSGVSQPRARRDLPDAGSVIVVYTDPVTLRGWWEDDL